MAINDGTARSYRSPPRDQGVVTAGQNYLNASSSQLVKAGPGDLVGIFTASTNAGTFQLFDSETATDATTQIATTFTATLGWHAIQIAFKNGLYIKAGGSVWFTVSYN